LDGLLCQLRIGDCGFRIDFGATLRLVRTPNGWMGKMAGLQPHKIRNPQSAIPNPQWLKDF